MTSLLCKDDVCSGNFIYYFSHWHYWIIDDHVDVNGTTTPLTATSKCIGTNSPTQYILGVQLCFPTKNCAVENGERFTLCSVDVDSFLIFLQAKILDSAE